ncbi:ribosomal protein S6--L-glutamate ligase [Halohasta litchfieldiae]|jgi:ribosomal protein S6--L-glutamate ligase|uniref:SSU ribosomal protein S6P modification protein n=1 Tax=Halohasta litchfieldiae TaxID=1073996 RepID=A0A1H6W805_9EURY|nr:RimK family alpha-L-glutamate ligase [Halohasta litchfieldiae]ATW89521.1 ribosomal protein S6--L-glutamate ligase [Halohasta litchfieldiae]SEJ11364.1 SSU ribosomal protein S6P modification protein [Halohasta litchfieldiae]
MLRLAVSTSSETFDRIREPLADRGIEIGHLQAKERLIQLTGREPVDPTAEFDVGFVYPGRLMEGAAIDAVHDLPWVNSRESVLTSRNKGGVIAALDAANLPVPESVMLSNPVDESVVTDAVGDLSFPVVIKPNSATRGVGVAKAADMDSLLGIVDYLNLIHDFRSTGDKSYLIQEYLPDARDYRVMVVDGDCVGAVERRLPEKLADGRWKHNVHRGAEATGIELPAEHQQLAEQVAEVLGISYLGVDLLETPDRLVVNETNARPTVDAATKYDEDFYDRLATLINRTANTA